jgi:tRNA threonylcarbamoyladenosine biosynthesis protein TsaE
MLTIESPGESVTLEVGRLVGEELLPGDVLALWGELGAGKTLITRGMARGLEIPEEVRITSPTFTFINEYDGRLHLYHLDLYRLADESELDMLPWREAIFGTGVAAIEWPERLGERLPGERWDIRLTVTGDESRAISIGAHGESLLKRLERLAERFRERWAPIIR